VRKGNLTKTGRQVTTLCIKNESKKLPTLESSREERVGLPGEQNTVLLKRCR